ncbi:MAG: DUF1385 domain-containing protein [Lachnospiraceae bacterium]|nr:DUF1385 domain-containing protein [Lachnospiraceae bacterium]
MAKKRRRLCNSGIGGQAVLEGVMMKNKDLYAVAVRKPDGEIDIETAEYHGIFHDKKIAKVPFIRGAVNMVDSLILGMRALNYSASFYEDDQDQNETEYDREEDIKKEKLYSAITVISSLVLAIGIFMVLPYFLSTFLERYVRNNSLLTLIEGVIRLAIFLIYIVSITMMKDIRRLYMYHGAEHKCINCIERGHELTVENVRKSSRFHKRCGTSFLLFVMVVSVILFMFISVENPALKVLFRLLLLPVIAGISYEIIRLAGRSDNILLKIISAPGAALQKLTTKEPDDQMIEVAIKSVEAVFDWRAFIDEKFTKRAKQEEAESDVETESAVEAESAEQFETAEETVNAEVNADLEANTESEPDTDDKE